jgi:outer membrane protein assembly factor BamB
MARRKIVPASRSLVVIALFAGAHCSSSSSPFTVAPNRALAPRASVLTHHNDNARTGANLQESVLTPDAVRTRLGFLFALPVDGFVYAQPLYVADLALPGGATRDVLYVATEHDSVYAFDANAAGAPLWQRSLGSAATLRCFPQRLLTPEIGITGTPVIDRTSETLYVVAFSADNAVRCDPPNFHHRLYAIDLATGGDKTPPVELATRAPIPFVTSDHLQRAALLLDRGVVYTAFASHADHEPYHGWLLANDAQTLALLAAYVDTPTGTEGGIWMAGEGPSVDENGDLFLSTGNGTFDADRGGRNFGDSVLALSLSSDALVVRDSFTPYNQEDLQERDLDLGSMGPVVIPGTHRVGGRDRRLVVVGGKEGKLYLLDRDALGGFHADGDRALQTLAVTGNYVMGGPVWFADGRRERLFLWPPDASIQALTLGDAASGAYLAPSDRGAGATTTGLPGGFLSLSADGTHGAVLWANHPWAPYESDADAIEHVVEGVLRAYDADDLSVELWNSRADPSAPDESHGAFAKFCPPTVANGKVYFPAWHEGADAPGSIIVYGLSSP